MVDSLSMFFGRRNFLKRSPGRKRGAHRLTKSQSYITVGGRKKKLYRGKGGGLYYRTKGGKSYVSKKVLGRKSHARSPRGGVRRRRRKGRKVRRRRRKGRKGRKKRRCKRSKKARKARARYHRKHPRAKRKCRARFGQTGGDYRYRGGPLDYMESPLFPMDPSLMPSGKVLKTPYTVSTDGWGTRNAAYMAGGGGVGSDTGFAFELNTDANLAAAAAEANQVTKDTKGDYGTVGLFPGASGFGRRRYY